MAVAEPDLPEGPAAPEAQVAAEIAPEASISEPAGQAPFLEPESTIGDTPLSAIERMDIPPEPSPTALRRDRILIAAWAASFVVLAGLGVAGYAGRNALMKQWPASKRVYATLGLAPPEGKTGDGTGGMAKAGGAKAGDAAGTARQGATETPAR